MAAELPVYRTFLMIHPRIHLVSMVTLMLSTLVPRAQALCDIRLVETVYSVREGNQLTIDVIKTGTAASPVNVVIEVSEYYIQVCR